MVDISFRPLANIRGRAGDKGEKGDTGTLAFADAKSVPAGAPAAVRMVEDYRGEGAKFDIPRGLPGTNAVANDEAFAAYIAALDSETSEALESRFTPKGVFFVNVADIGATLDGVTDDTVAIQDAIDAWSGTFGVLKLTAPPGSSIRTDGWTVLAKSVIFDFRDSHISTSTTAPILYAEGEWGPVVSVGQATNTTLTVTDTSGFAVGDIVKVFSNDVISDARPRNEDERPRRGEFAVVQRIDSGTEMRINPPLYDSFSNNVRVSKLIHHHVEFHFGTAAPVEGTPDSNDGQAMFRFRSLMQPVLTGKCLWNNAAFSGFSSCYMPVADVDVAHLPASNGYGVSSGRNVGGSFTIRANRVRHAYTDDTSPIAIGSTNDPASYGRSMYDTIRGMSFSTWSASWDTHHGGIGHKFLGVIGTGVQNQANGAVFALRGRHHELHSCSAHAAQWAIRIFDEGESTYDTWAQSDNHKIVGFTGRDTWNGVAVVATNMVAPGNGMTAWFEGGVFETRGGLPLHIQKGRVNFSGKPVFVHKSETPPSGNVLMSTTVSDVRGELALHARAMSSGLINHAVRFSDSSPSFQQVDLDVDLVLSAWAAANTNYLVSAGSAIGRINFTVNTETTATAVQAGTATTGEFVHTLRTLGVNTGSTTSSALRRQVPDSTEFTLNTGRSADPNVTIAMYNDQARAVTAITSGAFSGQILTVLNYDSSFGNINVRANASNVSLPAQVSIAPGESARFVWDGSTSAWRSA